MMASRRAAWVLVAAAAVAPPVGAANHPAGEVPVLTIAGGGSPEGELAVIRADGSIARRLIGLGEPISLSRVADGRYLIIDQKLRRILELDLDGRTLWQWRYGRSRPQPVSAAVLQNGHILYAAGLGGAVEIDRSGATVWRAPGFNHFVTAAVRLPDGDTLLAVRHSAHSLFVVGPDGRDPIELQPPGEHGHGHWKRLAPVAPDGSEVMLWDPDWPEVYQIAIRNRRLAVLGSTPAWRAVHLCGDIDHGLAWGGDLDLLLRLWRRDIGVREIDLLYPVTGIAPGPLPDELVITFQRVPDASWPESRRRLEGSPPVRSRRLIPWLVVGLLVVAALHLLAWQRPAPAPPDSPADAPPGRPARPVGRLAVVVTTALMGGCLALVWHGIRELRTDLASGWLPPLLGGAVGAALLLELWRRLVLRRPDPFWRATTAARPRLEAPVAMAVGCAILLGGCLLLGWWRAVSADVSAQLGLWMMLIIVTLGLAFLSERPPWRRHLAIDWRFWVAMAVPLAIASFTMLFRLRDIPVFLHFDHVYYASAAVDLLEGSFRSPWDFGFVPGPLVGLVAPLVGLLIAGPGEVGFRLGSALFGISGVVAAGILGRCYRDRRTGVFAATLLAGSIPYIHFSRTGANGDAATASLWTLAMFALAARSGRPRWWLLTGTLSGLCLYLWPGARVAVVACAVAGLLMAARSPRAAARRWFGVPLALLALAVWITPLLATWHADPTTMVPRAEVSLEVFKPSSGFNPEALSSAFGVPLARSLGWFFVLPDSSTHGTITPGCNEVEATLLAVGLVIVIIEGFSINLLLAAQLIGVLLILGAFGDWPPWYTRLVPSMPVAALLMARAAVGSLDLLASCPRAIRGTALARRSERWWRWFRWPTSTPT